MSEISVELNAVSSVIKKCKSIQSGLKAEAASMVQKYDSLGSGWNDEKYRELGQIVHNCSNALKQPIYELQRCEVYLQQILKIISEYESISLGNSSGQGASPTDGEQGSRSVGAGGIGGFGGVISSIFGRNQNISRALRGVEHRPIQPATGERNEQQIISSISGGDMTEGSCSSLAFAYAGNRAGYVVYDFRDGQSREVFSTRSHIDQIANLEGVNSVILRGTDDSMCAEQLMTRMERGREYYMATGSHAAIVRLNNEGVYQYLELQSGVASENGWHPLTLTALAERFGCEEGQSTEYTNYLIELSSLQNNAEFLNLLGYINTDELSQVRGEGGHVR